MSTFETKTADNFIFDEALDPREHLSGSTPFLKRNLVYIPDQQAGNGTYTPGDMIFDSTSVASSGNVNAWRDMIIAHPFNTKVEFYASSAVTVTAPGSDRTAIGRSLIAHKNFCDVESVKVEANGKTLITATQGLEAFNTFKFLCTNTQDSLHKDAAVVGFYPDDVGQVGAAFSSYNAANNPLAPGITTSSYGANRGLIERQQNMLPTFNTNFMTTSNVANEGGTVDLGVGFPATAPTTPGTATLVSDIHGVRIIRGKDLCDFLDKHNLSRGVGYRFTLKFNQAVSTITFGTASITTPFSVLPTGVSTSITSGSKQPAMLCAGPGSVAAGLTFNTNATATLVISHAIDTTVNARINGGRLYLPSYELDPSHQEKLMASPSVTKEFMDFTTATTQTYAAPGAQINVQVSTSATNPRALIIVPSWSASAPTGGPTYGQAYLSERSPLSTVPGSTDGLLSLRDIQIKMGSDYILPDRLNYNWSAFIDHTGPIFALNGNQTAQTSGLITKKMWETNHRYYAFDLSRYPQAMNNLPQMISLECINNSAVAIELRCYLVYGRSAEFNLANGTLSVTA